MLSASFDGHEEPNPKEIAVRSAASKVNYLTMLRLANAAMAHMVGTDLTNDERHVGRRRAIQETANTVFQGTRWHAFQQQNIAS